MKEIKLYLILIIIPISAFGQEVYTDVRDNKNYKTFEIGEQQWFAENLAFKTEQGSWAYSENKKHIDKYGRLYTWEAAKHACPDGWHLPTDEEWKTLEKQIGLCLNELDTEGYRGDQAFIGDLLKADSLKLNSEISVLGFNIVFAGCRHDFTGGFTGLNQNTYFWADSHKGFAPGRRLRKDKKGIYRSLLYPKEDAYSVRCTCFVQRVTQFRFSY